MFEIFRQSLQKEAHTHTGVGQRGYRGVTRGIQGVRVFVEDIFCLFWAIVAMQTDRQAGRPAPPSVARPRQLNLIPNCQFSVRKRQQQQQQHRQQHCVLSASEKETGVEGGFACVHYATTKRKTKQSFQFDD